MPELFPLVTPVSFAPDLIARYRERRAEPAGARAGDDEVVVGGLHFNRADSAR